MGDAATDRAVVERMAAGDPDALASLYDRHATAVYSLALRIVGAPSDAEDVTQEVFTQAWRTAARFDGTRGEVAAWLLMMSRSRALDALRSRRRRPAPSLDEDAAAAIPDPSPSVEYIVATHQQVAGAQVALDRLPAEQRKALELAYYEGLTHVEIAERTSSPLGTVKTRIRTALASVRTALADSQAARLTPGSSGGRR
ncbi:MAG TPA: sigma-70 family RNA polymerase sigma factor [Vicinamibacterales bacterium]|nr:sigma-70 family RNA polymerase sigma factor [Vicinamibacterales bacterium]